LGFFETAFRQAILTKSVRIATYLSHLFFHPPRFPGAPPVNRGDGPNSGPDSRQLVGWMILLVLPNGLAGRVRLAR
jgi:hypothetical protein